MELAKEIIRQQSALKEWFEHANRQYEISKDDYKEGYKREFDNLIENGNKLAQIPEINSLDLLCDITDGSPQNEYLSTELKEKWLIHLKEGDINHKLRFFNSLLNDRIISFKEYSGAYHLAHILNWNMESNSIAGKEALKRAGYYNNTQQDNPKVEEQRPNSKLPKQDKKELCFRDIVQYDDKDALINRLHALIDGKRGADVGSVLLKARQNNYITRNPTKKEFESEFQLLGSWSAISNYMNDNNVNALDRANRIVIFS